MTTQNGDTEKDATDPKASTRLPPFPIHKSFSLVHLPSTIKEEPRDGSRPRYSIDTNSLESMTRNTITNDADYLYSSGLRRIRQQNPSISQSPISGKGPWSTPGSRVGSISLGPTSPKIGSCEDLTRFPSESLHSYSFAHQSDDLIHSRHNILKRSIEFMRDKLGWAASSPMIQSAQAKVEGDEDMLHMMQLLQNANLVGAESNLGSGPLTGPAIPLSESNIFEASFSKNTAEGSKYVEEPGEMDPSESVIPSEANSRSTTNNTNKSAETDRTTPPLTPRTSLKRTNTDTSPLTLQTKLLEALAQPYLVGDTPMSAVSNLMSAQSALGGPEGRIGGGRTVHNHSSRYSPASQAIFTTESSYPWTILAANDLACLVFGVTKAEVRRIGILEVIKEERREWLASKLRVPDSSRRGSTASGRHQTPPPPVASALGLKRVLSARGKNSPRRARTEDGNNIGRVTQSSPGHHEKNKSRGVILCGDVVPIQKRNGTVAAASLWVKEKKGGLIWVLEEINEDVATLHLAEDDCTITRISGDCTNIFGERQKVVGESVQKLLPGLPVNDGKIDYEMIGQSFTVSACNGKEICVPCSVDAEPNDNALRLSSFPHIAGIIILDASTLKIHSSNSVFSSALFGYKDATDVPITDLVPTFDRMLKLIEEEDKISLVDGIVVPEHLFRRARAILAIRDGKVEAAAAFLRPNGLPAKHRDGGDLKIDIQMRVVTSEQEAAVIDEKSPLAYALWITYSRHLHTAVDAHLDPLSHLHKPVLEEALHQPSPGQSGTPVLSRTNTGVNKVGDEGGANPAAVTRSLERVLANDKPKSSPLSSEVKSEDATSSPDPDEAKKSIKDFVILEDMGQGAYGQVKLARDRKSGKRMVIKYVTKKRILVDTWTRDRKLGTVPLEIHVLDFLRREDLVHPNIVEMADFFEDDVNYYIEMVPHGLPGMDLFDYIELKVNMDEKECRSIFVQVAEAVQHLHTKALVVHRDIKDENVILDGEGKIKLIDFGSAAYIKNGPFDVFVGTIDYAAPEVLAGKSYRGKEQDVWALGVLLYTILYKENPFYNIDEIMDRDLRIPYILSDNSIDLIKNMLNRDVEARLTITQVLEHPWCMSTENAVPPPITTPNMDLTQQAKMKGAVAGVAKTYHFD